MHGVYKKVASEFNSRNSKEHLEEEENYLYNRDVVVRLQLDAQISFPSLL